VRSKTFLQRKNLVRGINEPIPKNSPSKSDEITVARVVDLNQTPRVYSSPNGLTVDFNFFLRTDDSKRK
jgi:hypothetical protein